MQFARDRERILQQEQAAREEAEQANRLKDEFLAVLSHELRTPLNPILGWTKLLQTGRLDAEKQGEALKTIERNAKLQAQLIEDLLDISRIMRGKLTLKRESADLASVISAASETVRPRHRSQTDSARPQFCAKHRIRVWRCGTIAASDLEFALKCGEIYPRTGTSHG